MGLKSWLCIVAMIGTPFLAQYLAHNGPSWMILWNSDGINPFLGGVTALVEVVAFVGRRTHPKATLWVHSDSMGNTIPDIDANGKPIL